MPETAVKLLAGLIFEHVKKMAREKTAGTAPPEPPEVNKQKLLPLPELAKSLPESPGQKRPTAAMLHRWATVGLKSRKGKNIRLMAKLVDGKICSSIDDVELFYDVRKYRGYG